MTIANIFPGDFVALDAVKMIRPLPASWARRASVDRKSRGFAATWTPSLQFHPRSNNLARKSAVWQEYARTTPHRFKGNRESRCRRNPYHGRRARGFPSHGRSSRSQ